MLLKSCKNLLVLLSLSCTIPLLTVQAAQQELVLKTQTSWDGGALSYPKGDAEITVVRLQLDKVELTPFHCHPVPTMGMVTAGRIEVETIDGKKTTFQQGDAVVEVMKTVHRGRALNGPVDLMVFYAGATNLPNTAPADSALCKPALSKAATGVKK